MKPAESYHHGNLRSEIIRLGLEALETGESEELSMRALAEKAGVSKTAPYRHFADREAILGALADEGFRLLYEDLEKAAAAPAAERVGAMGRAYMAFAVSRPALYRLMNSPLICRLPDEMTAWARRSLDLLAEVLARRGAGRKSDPDAATAAWAYIHGLVLIRIDGLYPERLPEPDWDELASRIPEALPAASARPKRRRSGP